MDKGVPSSLFVNDGSFMERFKQLQQEKEKDNDKKSSAAGEPRPVKILSATLAPNPTINKTSVDLKANDTRKTTHAVSTGKLAFSLKQKSKLAAPPVKLGADEDEDEEETGDGNVSGDAAAKRQKLGQPDDHEQASRQLDGAPSSPSDPTVKKVADKLASFVAKNGRQFEDVTRQKNPGDTPFQFLFDKSSADYKYYEYRLAEEEKALSQNRESQTSRSGWSESQTSRSGTNGIQRSFHQQSNYQIPASALYESNGSSSTLQTGSAERAGESGAPPTGADPIAMMEYYMKKAAHEERKRQPKHSKDEMPPPLSLQASGKRGHHMGDYIPPEELEKFMASCNDASAQKAAKKAAEKSKIQADNVGHKLLSKMGWKEGEGLGSSKSGIANPIMAGDVKTNNLGVGANNPGEVHPEDDIYEQYKKRMMLGYRHRPNPLGNPRKAYY
ncbi:SURP and G-patch domain-containing protein 1-like protein [Morus notabilis]|uniref:SURP and G-patch domain-containing protein 1-like protein n=1 Tax=Morus notabilis TaxID=981085 RepID=UPI000CED3E58|nr:SURP and G-patch domain-containing protein 1-like protein [Morus notabilis]XP_024023338.1 SURP and G-patch domain-containing protein 1-like protein [Morus notabilis]XP_024023342.1 SURP and G-patch domain-containing protein 1-like protein [Morus notabilis]